MIFEICLKM